MDRAKADAEAEEIPTRRTSFATAGASKAGFTGAGGLAGDGLGGGRTSWLGPFICPFYLRG